MYGRKKTWAVASQIFTKLVKVQQQYVQLSRDEFHSKTSINVGNVGRNVVMALNVVWVSMGRLLTGCHAVLKIHQKGLIADTVSVRFLQEARVRKFSKNLVGYFKAHHKNLGGYFKAYHKNLGGYCKAHDKNLGGYFKAHHKNLGGYCKASHKNVRGYCKARLKNLGGYCKAHHKNLGGYC